MVLTTCPGCRGCGYVMRAEGGGLDPEQYAHAEGCSLCAGTGVAEDFETQASEEETT